MDPVVNKRAERWIPVSMPNLGAAEEAKLAECVRRNWISSGRECDAFEREFSEAHGRAHGVTCTSGTVALKLALALFDIGPGDTVIVPSQTMIAVANAVLYRGATPRFVDCTLDGDLSIDHLVEQIDKHKPRAVIVAHLYGRPDQASVNAVLDINDAVLIEDCAEAHYARFPNGDPVGCHADAATFSFYSNKIITTGEGGMVLVDSDKDEAKLKALRAHAFTPGNHFHHQFMAYGERMPDLLAAVGRCQHDRKDEFLRKRDAIALQYSERLDHLFATKNLTRWNVGPGGVWWVYPIFAPDRLVRDTIRKNLADAGVETRTFFHPLHLQSHLKVYAEGRLLASEELGECGLYLPVYVDLTASDVDYICDIVEGTFK